MLAKSLNVLFYSQIPPYLKLLNQHSDLSTFRGLPQIPRDVEESGLEEEDEADPLVVLVVLDLSSILEISVRRDA
jgi:hypothetical protein